MMNYSEFVDKFLRDKDKDLHGFIGLAAEAGEVLDLYKKERIYEMHVYKEKYIDELGDTFFYFQGILNNLDITLEEVQSYNRKKLTKRYGVEGPDGE